MKGLYERYKSIDMTLREFCDTGRIAEFPNAMGRKLMWLLASSVLGKDIDLGSLKDSIPVPRKKVELGNIDEIMTFSNDVNFYSKEYPELSFSEIDFAYRSDVVPDRVVSDIKGKYWSVSTWENSLMFCCEGDMEYFHDFLAGYQEKEDVRLTDEDFDEFREILSAYVSLFLPKCIVNDMVDYLLECKRDIFFAQPYEEHPEIEVFKDDFEYTIIEDMVFFLRFGYEDKKNPKTAELSKSMCIRGFRERFDLSEAEMSDKDVFECFKSLYDQPLMVEFLDMSYSFPVEYAILKSKSLGFILYNSCKDRDGFLKGLSKELQYQLREFLDILSEEEAVFPYEHLSAVSNGVDIYLSEQIYVCGMYTSLVYDNCNREVDTCGNFIAPSLQDLYLLEWADRLYDRILKEKGE